MSSHFIPSNVRIASIPDMESKSNMKLMFFPLDAQANDIGTSWKNFQKDYARRIKEGIIKTVDMKNESLDNLEYDRNNSKNYDKLDKKSYFLWNGLDIEVDKNLVSPDEFQGSESFVISFVDGKLSFLNKESPNFEKEMLKSSFINEKAFLQQRATELDGLYTDGYIFAEGTSLYHCVGKRRIFSGEDVMEINLTSLGLMMNYKNEYMLNVENLGLEHSQIMGLYLGEIDILFGDLSSLQKVPSSLSLSDKIPFGSVCIGKTIKELMSYLGDVPGYESLKEHANLNRESILNTLNHEVSWGMEEDMDFLETHYKDMLKTFLKKAEVGEFNILNMYVFDKERKLYMIELNMYQAYEGQPIDINFGVYQVNNDTHTIIKGFNNETDNFAMSYDFRDGQLVNQVFDYIMHLGLEKELGIKACTVGVNTKDGDKSRFFNVTIKPTMYKG